MSVLDLPRNQILQGDATAMLATLPAASVDCVITSPPYFRLRDYGVDGQLGLEQHVDQWVGDVRSVVREVARVLVPTGTLWFNVGDAYSTNLREGAARKSLLLGPERLGLALIEDGWTIRNKIVWAKTNTIPSSVTDRLSTKHELIYLLTRSNRYYFDLDTIRVPHTSHAKPRKTGPPSTKQNSRPAWLGPNSDGDRGLAAMHAAGITGHPLGKNPGDVWSMSVSQYRGAHFATYPQHLVERMLLAGCPAHRCSKCRAPWVRVLKRDGTTASRSPPQPTCDCDVEPEPGLVLDPFIGSGTTAVAAAKLDRDWLGIELNTDYIRLADERIADADNRPSNRKEVT